MAVFDVREDKFENITEIVFQSDEFIVASKIIRNYDGGTFFADHEGNVVTFCFSEIENVDNFILALQKAKELGWVK